MSLFNTVVTFLKKLTQPCEYRSIDNVESDQVLSKYDKIFISFFVLSGNVLTNSLIESYSFSKFVFHEMTVYYENLNSITSAVNIVESNEKVLQEESKEDSEEDVLNKRCTVERNDDGEWNATIVQMSELEQMKDEDHNILEKEKDKDI
tara:strand:- start:41 stop:487 length:447 start_codon:yes stop_codon:yes gene_type:complete